MKKLIITADDYGFTKSINDGIVRAVVDGMITDIAVQVLTDEEDLQHGLSLLRKHHLTEVGLHTSLFHWGKTNRPKRQDFINFFQHATDAEIYEKAHAEIQIFENLFKSKPKFIAPQFNMHGNLRLLKVLADYAVNYNIPMRIPWSVLTQDELENNNYAAQVYLKRLGVHMTDHLFAHMLGSNANQIEKQFLNELATVTDGQTTEILFHPGYFDHDVLHGSSLNYERPRDLDIATNTNFRQSIIKLGFQFGHFSDL